MGMVGKTPVKYPHQLLYDLPNFLRETGDTSGTFRRVVCNASTESMGDKRQARISHNDGLSSPRSPIPNRISFSVESGAIFPLRLAIDPRRDRMRIDPQPYPGRSRSRFRFFENYIPRCILAIPPGPAFVH